MAKSLLKHEDIAKCAGASCYFAKPYRSWERGLNEHTNGLVRQFLPKRTKFANLKNSQIKKIQKILTQDPEKP